MKNSKNFSRKAGESRPRSYKALHVSKEIKKPEPGVAAKLKSYFKNEVAEAAINSWAYIGICTVVVVLAFVSISKSAIEFEKTPQQRTAEMAYAKQKQDTKIATIKAGQYAKFCGKARGGDALTAFQFLIETKLGDAKKITFADNRETALALAPDCGFKFASFVEVGEDRQRRNWNGTIKYQFEDESWIVDSLTIENVGNQAAILVPEIAN